MDENELRISAAEKAILALAPWIDDQRLADAIETLRGELAGEIDDDERAAVLGAIELLQDGRNRFAGPELTTWLRRP